MSIHHTSYTLGLIIGLLATVVVQLPRTSPRMVACDVGQGDAILLIKGSTQVLIDGGPSGEKILSCLSRHIPFWDRQIELIVLTNTDFDHMNGLTSVLERYSSMYFVTSDGVHDSDALERFVTELGHEGAQIQGVEQGEIISVGTTNQLRLKVLWPPQVVREYVAIFHGQIAADNRSQILGASAKRGDLNERSVVLLWEEGDYKILLMGDAGDQAEIAMMESGILSDVDVLKVGHHGSKYASTLEFLDSTKPEKAVISVGSKNRYGHPTDETLGRLSQRSVEIYRTDLIKDVTIHIK